MRTTIDGGGRVVIPKAMRVRLGITPGCEVEVIDTGTGVLVEPAGGAARLETAADGLPVIVSNGPTAALSDDDVRAILESIRP